VDSNGPVPEPLKTSGGERLLRTEAARLFTPFRFTDSQKIEIWEAFKTNPDGVERCALKAKAVGQRNGSTGAGLLLAMIRGEEHLLEAQPETPLPTGWRWVRGAGGASGTFVEDPEGTDRLPPGYDFTPSPHYESPSAEVESVPLTDEIRAELERLRPGPPPPGIFVGETGLGGSSP
jgi:hypothetical protein